MAALTLSDASAPTLSGALERIARFLERRGVEGAKRDARTLLLAASGLTHAELVRDPLAPLSAQARRKLCDFARRRAARQPVARIIGTRGFWTLDLNIAPGVFDPRADTETLVELALGQLRERRDRDLAILDLGAGSGAIACALLSEFRNARALAVDLSAHACAIAKANFARCGLTERANVLRGRWADAINAAFDLVVSNPPYIPSKEISNLAPEVTLHDPELALDGGADGLACYRQIAGDLGRLLKPHGLALLEVGAGQARDVSALLVAQSLEIAEIGCDIAGHERIVAARRTSGSPR